ncbi:hypothetical protein ABH894_003103 [Paenibacillus sp. RC62]
MAFNENSKLSELLANKAAITVLEKHLPGISTNPMASMGKGMSLKQLAAIPQANMPQELITAIVSDLTGIGEEGVQTKPHERSPADETKTGEFLDRTVPIGSVAIITGEAVALVVLPRFSSPRLDSTLLSSTSMRRRVKKRYTLFVNKAVRVFSCKPTSQKTKMSNGT